MDAVTCRNVMYQAKLERCQCEEARVQAIALWTDVARLKSTWDTYQASRPTGVAVIRSIENKRELKELLVRAYQQTWSDDLRMTDGRLARELPQPDYPAPGHDFATGLSWHQYTERQRIGDLLNEIGVTEMPNRV